MDKNQQYAVVYMEDEFSRIEKLAFFETKEELEQFVIKLHGMKTKTNQRLSEFARVFKKGALYPTEYDAFWEERRNGNRKRYSVIADYFVQRTLKSGKVKSKYYAFAEDFDWQLSEWAKKGSTDIYILDINEAFRADYYYKREIEKIWGAKDEPLVA